MSSEQCDIAIQALINAHCSHPGQYVVNEELYREAPEGARNRFSTTARFFKDTVHDIGLDDWIEAQGGMVSAGVEYYSYSSGLPPPLGSTKVS